MADETKERILAAALDLFSTRGFSAVSTKAIAEAAAVNEVTLFRIFSTKRKLYMEVFRRYSIPADDPSILSVVTGDIHGDLFVLARAISNLFVRNSKLVRMSLKDLAMFEDIDRDLKRQPELLTAQVVSFFKRRLEAGPGEGERERIARTFVDAIFAVTIHYVNIGATEADFDDFLRTFSRIFSAGLGSA